MMIARLLLATLCSALTVIGDQIPPFFIDSVVALGKMEVRVPGQPPEWTAEASGFLFGDPQDKETAQEKHLYNIYLVTNRHVISDHALTMRVNNKNAADSVQDIELPLKNPDGTNAWISHPDPAIDISVIRLNGPYLRDHGWNASFFAADTNTADRAKLKGLGISAGDGVFVLGFPMGLSGTAKRNYVIARSGSIARISDLFESVANSFLIDALIFPGNSGGPVISALSNTSLEGTRSQNVAYLIGVVRAYLPYTDIAISQQTKQIRMVSQENSGLAEVVPMDYITETIKAFNDADKKRLPTQAPKKP